jgi:hypothetical protein
LEKVSGVVPATRDASFEPDFFGGYCNKRGGYIAMNLPPADFDITKIYGV